jgi:peptide deformylase
MVLNVVKYGHPVLRKKGAKIEKLTPEIRKLISDMLETMRAAHGIGLAAQQVGEALQIAVIDVSPVTDRPSTLERNGHPAEVNEFMPLVLINPEIKPYGDMVPGPEGCLSFPEIFSDISRPSHVEVKAMNENGDTIEFKAGGLLSRAVQHEVDHLNGILFIDRMSRSAKDEVQVDILELQTKTKAALKL